MRSCILGRSSSGFPPEARGNDLRAMQLHMPTLIEKLLSFFVLIVSFVVKKLQSDEKMQISVITVCRIVEICVN